jgi:hypothetical protein
VHLEAPPAQRRRLEVDAGPAVAEALVAFRDAAHRGAVQRQIEGVLLLDGGERAGERLGREHREVLEDDGVEPGGLVHAVADPEGRVLAAVGELGRDLGLELHVGIEREPFGAVGGLDRGDGVVGAAGVEHAARGQQVLVGNEGREARRRERLDAVEHDLAHDGVLLDADDEDRPVAAGIERHADGRERPEAVHAVAFRFEVDAFGGGPGAGGDEGPDDVGVRLGALDADLRDGAAHLRRLRDRERREGREQGDEERSDGSAGGRRVGVRAAGAKRRRVHVGSIPPRPAGHVNALSCAAHPRRVAGSPPAPRGAGGRV